MSKLLGPSWPLPEDALARASRVIQNPSVTLMMRAYQEPAHLATIWDLMERQSRIVATGSAIEAATRRALGEPSAALNALDRLNAGSMGSTLRKAYEAMNLNDVVSSSNALRHALAQYGYPSEAEGAFHDVSRAESWANVLAVASRIELEALFPNTDLIGSELRRLEDISAGIFAVSDAQRLAMDLASGRATYLLARRDTTVLKLSAFAGASDIFGPGTALGGAAFDTLFGKYRTMLDLPPAFWRRPEVRREFYEDADVDPGLIEAENDEVVDILIGGGVATHLDGRNGRVAAVVRVGQFHMRVTSTRTRHDAFALIDAFEVTLRAFISRKLEALSGEHWFKHRVNGDVLIRAKERRKEALRNSEPNAPLINFTDLGDLMTIIVRQDNWDATFVDTFQHIDRFKVDMERLIAMRRPTAHARSIDAVRLLEIVCVARRLQGAMEYDQPLDAGWDDDL